jgi:hypothetical protein
MLTLKPFTPLSENFQVSADLRVRGRHLEIEYKLSDPAKAVCNGIEAGGASSWPRADGLWQSTCFEAFLGEFGESGYWELNFSPGQRRWSCYRFEAYRLPQPPVASEDLELIQVECSADTMKCTVLAKKEMRSLECSLTAVIVTEAGIRYFALTHASTKPDFHRRDSFSLRL